MSQDKPLRLKYRWVVLFAMVSCGLLALAIALGTARREGVTVAFTVIPLAIALVAPIPLSLPRIVAHGWFTPITATWICSTSIAIYFGGVWLLGLGHQCDWVVLTAVTSMFCALNIGWLAGRLWRRTAAYGRHQLVRSIQAAMM